EDDPDQTALSADTAVGSYTASLQPGWRLERLDGGSATTIPAELVSDNPSQFLVFARQRADVELQFRVLGMLVSLGQGYALTVTVEELPRPVAVVSNSGSANSSPSIQIVPLNAAAAAPPGVIFGAATTLQHPAGVAVVDDQIIVCDPPANA